MYPEASSKELMMYREIIAVCSQIHIKHINTLCGQNVDFPPLLASNPFQFSLTAPKPQTRRDVTCDARKLEAGSVEQAHMRT
jgi:hypothetical protein